MATFTSSLEQAIARAAALPPQEQDEIAALILTEIEDEQRWEKLFRDRRSPVLLERLAAEALADDDAGLAESLDALLADENQAADRPTSPRG